MQREGIVKTVGVVDMSLLIKEFFLCFVKDIELVGATVLAGLLKSWYSMPITNADYQ